MLGLAGTTLGLECVFYAKTPDPCARRLGRVYTSAAAFANAADIYTYEFENAPLPLAAELARANKLFPSLQALVTAGSRIKEKQIFHQLGISTVRWRMARNVEELEDAAAELGFPFLLKTESLGYDGKGQIQIKDRKQLRAQSSQLFTKSITYIAEEWCNFKRELSQLSVRARDGQTAHYPPIENHHERGILSSSWAPAALASHQLKRLQRWTTALMTELDYVGVLALEIFDCGDQLLANEFAPRVHNSGHWTIEGATTSQFANHLRAICGLPLGKADARGHAMMVNCVGQLPPMPTQGYMHIYGKAPRPGRKLGHITYVADSPQAVMKMRRSLKNHALLL